MLRSRKEIIEMLLFKWAALACVWICGFRMGGNGVEAFPTTPMLADWDSYKKAFDLTNMFTTATEPFARYNYIYNRNLINRHNTYERNGQRSFTLAENKFSSMRLTQFNALFPKTTQPINANNQTASPLSEATAANFDPRVAVSLVISVEDQGVQCNSGWAYAVAKSVELMQAMQMSMPNANRLSAQVFIDCAGRTSSCKSQVPQTAFDYLTLHHQELYEQADYPNRNTTSEPGMCIIPATAVLTTVPLTKYACIAAGDDETIKRAVFAQLPVVIEFDPTSFEFIHYAGGVFQQPTNTRGGSHFMTVVGYGTDEVRKLDYWLALNSFGERWGEKGFIRILRSSAKPLASSACYPTDL